MSHTDESSKDHDLYYLSTNIYGADSQAHWGIMICKHPPPSQQQPPQQPPQLGTLHNYLQTPHFPTGHLSYQQTHEKQTPNKSLYGGIIHLTHLTLPQIHTIEDAIVTFDRITTYPENYRCAPWVFDVLTYLEEKGLTPKGHSEFLRTQRLTHPSIIKENVKTWGKGEWFDGPLARNEGMGRVGVVVDAKYEERVRSEVTREVGRLDKARLKVLGGIRFG